MVKSRTPVMVTVKSKLAQLLAAENIRIEHLPVATAFFNMQARVLVCPIWKDMDGDLYDLCMGHEVGHALNTPADGWHGSLVRLGKGFQAYINVCEDARIERKIKSKFPGLRAPFARAYIELNKRNFFKIGEKDPNKFSLIDKINIYFKLGHVYNVKFTAEEQPYVTALERADTWEQVLDIAEKLYARAKKLREQAKTQQSGSPQSGKDGEQKQEKKDGKTAEGKSKAKNKKSKDGKGKDGEQSKEQQQSEQGGGECPATEKEDSEESPGDDNDEQSVQSSGEGEEGKDSESGTGSGDADEDGEPVTEEDDEGLDGDGDDDGEATDSAEKAGDKVSKESAQQGEETDDYDREHIHDGEDESEEEPTSVTDDAFRAAEGALVDRNSTGIRTAYLPDLRNVKNMIAPMELIYTSIESGVDRAFTQWAQYYNSNVRKHTREDFAKRALTEILTDNKPYIDMLVKEFELRKNATQYARTMTAKTGELDCGQLHKYRFTNDIFRKVQTVPKGKNHGMLFFLDMSSSMTGIMGATVKQLLVLCAFCKRVNVPFDVYGYADGECFGFKPEKFLNDPTSIQMGGSRNFHLKHLLSSSCGGNEYRRAFQALAMYSNIFYGQTSREMKKYLFPSRMRGVPFSDSDMNMQLNGTPYNKMLLASRQIIEEFKAAKRLDIVNVIHLSDGDGTDDFSAPGIDYNDPNANDIAGSRIAVTDRRTQAQVVQEPYQKSQEVLTELVKRATGCRHIAFYVSSYIDGYVYQAKDEEEKKTAQETLAKEGYFRISKLGYDSYYFMSIPHKPKDEEEISNDTYRPLEDRFIEHQRNKAKARGMARSFASELAEQIKR